MDIDTWPFNDPPNLAVICLKQIAAKKQPILHVTHDVEDESWQFLGWEDANEEDILVVALSSVFAIDPTLKFIADLPLGWHAWRGNVDDDWQRAAL